MSEEAVFSSKGLDLYIEPGETLPPGRYLQIPDDGKEYSFVEGGPGQYVRLNGNDPSRAGRPTIVLDFETEEDRDIFSKWLESVPDLKWRDPKTPLT